MIRNNIIQNIMNVLKEFWQGMYQKTHFWKRLIYCSVAIFIMGFCVSWLILVNMGTDPCTSMNLGISKTIGLSFGNWQAIFNIIVFIIVLIFDKGQIGFGTVINMFGVGYVCDFFTFIWSKVLPNGLPDILWIRLLIMVVVLITFVVAASIYMTVDLGTSPYDSVPMILWNKFNKINFRWIRITFDVSAALIGFFFGATVGIVTIIMAFALGPVIAWMRTRVEKLFV